MLQSRCYWQHLAVHAVCSTKHIIHCSVLKKQANSNYKTVYYWITCGSHDMWAESGQVPHARCDPFKLTNNSMCTKHIYEEILVTQQTVITESFFFPEAPESSFKTFIFFINVKPRTKQRWPVQTRTPADLIRATGSQWAFRIQRAVLYLQCLQECFISARFSHQDNSCLYFWHHI